MHSAGATHAPSFTTRPSGQKHPALHGSSMPAKSPHVAGTSGPQVLYICPSGHSGTIYNKYIGSIHNYVAQAVFKMISIYF